MGLQEQIDELMRWLCGIGASNQWAPPAMFEASTGIAMCTCYPARPIETRPWYVADTGHSWRPLRGAGRPGGNAGHTEENRIAPCPAHQSDPAATDASLGVDAQLRGHVMAGQMSRSSAGGIQRGYSRHADGLAGRLMRPLSAHSSTPASQGHAREQSRPGWAIAGDEVRPRQQPARR